MIEQYHSSSSADEGRNGSLSPMHHNGRGLTESRLKALTVIHNYGLKLSDGTTAAERLLGAAFPDHLGWLVNLMDGDSLTAKSSPASRTQPIEIRRCPGLSG